MATKKTDDLGQQLLDAFHRSGLSRFALSKQSGVGYAVIHRWVGGERDVKLKTASKIAAALGLKLSPTRKGKG